MIEEDTQLWPPALLQKHAHEHTHINMYILKIVNASYFSTWKWQKFFRCCDGSLMGKGQQFQGLKWWHHQYLLTVQQIHKPTSIDNCILNSSINLMSFSLPEDSDLYRHLANKKLFFMWMVLWFAHARQILDHWTTGLLGCIPSVILIRACWICGLHRLADVLQQPHGLCIVASPHYSMPHCLVAPRSKATASTRVSEDAKAQAADQPPEKKPLLWEMQGRHL